MSAKAYPAARRPGVTLAAPSNATPEQIALAFAACRSIRFANDQAVRHGGEYSLNDLLAADRLAREALGASTRKERAA